MLEPACATRDCAVCQHQRDGSENRQDHGQPDDGQRDDIVHDDRTAENPCRPAPSGGSALDRHRCSGDGRGDAGGQDDDQHGQRELFRLIATSNAISAKAMAFAGRRARTMLVADRCCERSCRYEQQVQALACTITSCDGGDVHDRAITPRIDADKHASQKVGGIMVLAAAL